MTPSTIAAMCADYRASFHLDRADDDADPAAGHRIAVPLLVLLGEDEPQLADAPDVWRAWADDVTAATVPGGHFSPEEAPRGGRRGARPVPQLTMSRPPACPA